MTTFHHFDDLFELLRCHATPGDEDEVCDLLVARWRARGWLVTKHGGFAVSARPAPPDPAKPTFLVAAHMDSPGFIVEQRHPDRLVLIGLGKPHFVDEQAELVIKTARGRVRVVARRQKGENNREFFEVSPAPAGVAHGDRACYRVFPEIVAETDVISAFLDNRVGCFALTELAAEPRVQAALPVNLVVGATTSEEMNGFGAPVLAAALRPDLAVCLDATYEDLGQNVLIGRGSVLTLSDASVFLSTAVRDELVAWFAAHRLPLQTEVYNYSGTDARAFPQQGLATAVLSLLVATTGNHTPVERAALADLRDLHEALVTLALDPPRCLLPAAAVAPSAPARPRRRAR